MEILDYFQAVSVDAISGGKAYSENQLGSKIQFQPNSFEKIDLAIFSVAEDRGSQSNQGSAFAGNAVRSFLYELQKGDYPLQIADLGVMTPGDQISDTYFAIQDCVASLMKENVLPILIGGSADLNYAVYLAYAKLEQTINMVSIDPRFALGNTDDVINSSNYFSKILFHQPNALFNFSNLGYQSYFVDPKELDLIEELFFDIHRLGIVKADLTESEPIIRNADMLSFNMGAIAQRDAPSNLMASPNGFTGEQGCQLARYAGLSDKLSAIGFYEYNATISDSGQTAHLLAQMIWYFIDGFANRKKDFPACTKKEYTKYTVAVDEGERELNFYKSPKSDRWWMDVPYTQNFRSKYERHLMLPCSYADYVVATQNEIPERWFQTFKKLK